MISPSKTWNPLAQPLTSLDQMDQCALGGHPDEPQNCGGSGKILMGNATIASTHDWLEATDTVPQNGNARISMKRPTRFTCSFHS